MRKIIVLSMITFPAAFNLTEHVITTTGVIIACYKRAGKVKTENVGV